MPTVSPARLAELLRPYADPLPSATLAGLSDYLDLLLRWNQKTNLTAVRDPEVLIQRQIGESLFASKAIPPSASLLDFGSGAGFPGIPLALLSPELRVTLAEAQGKKAAFLREAVRTLRLQAEIWSSRVETMPRDRAFDVVAMRAVDDSAKMLPLAQDRVAAAGILLRYTAASGEEQLSGWDEVLALPIPLSQGMLRASLRQVRKA